MLKRIALIAALMLMAAPALPQDTGTVNVRGPLRGTPNSAGIVMAFLESGETFEVVEQKGPWYLLQTTKYVGWMHGSFIRVRTSGDDLPDLRAFEVKPRTTSKQVTGTADDSPFGEEYVGGSSSEIHISNSSNRTMNLDFGGIRYVMKNGKNGLLRWTVVIMSSRRVPPESAQRRACANFGRATVTLGISLSLLDADKRRTLV